MTRIVEQEVLQPGVDQSQGEGTAEQLDQLAGQIDGLMDSKSEGTAEGTPTPSKGREETEVKAGSEPGKVETAATPAATQLQEPPKDKIKWEGQELELTRDELVKLAQMGYDYTKKTQTLAEKERSLAPLEGIAKTIQSDPAFAQYLRDYFLKSQSPQQQQPKQFSDPVEELKYNLKEEIRQEFKKELGEKEKLFAHQMVIQKVRTEVQADPDYREVQGMLVDHLKSLPPATAQVVYYQWDQDPQAYLQAFGHFKRQLAQKKINEAPIGQFTQTQPTPSNNPQAVEQQRAPNLEPSGVEEPVTDRNTERAKKLSRMKAKALRSGDPAALAAWLEESGAIDNLF